MDRMIEDGSNFIKVKSSLAIIISYFVYITILWNSQHETIKSILYEHYSKGAHFTFKFLFHFRYQ